MSKIVYFLGAGASYCFGYPVTNDIMPGIMQSLHRKSLFQLGSRKTAGEKQQETDLLHYLKLLYPGIECISPEKEKTKMPSITEVLSLVDYFCFYNMPAHCELSGGKLLYFRQLLNRAVGEFLLEFENTPYDTYEKALLKKFISPIRREKKEHDVSIITTNYDLTIDLAFEEALRNHEVDYGIPYRNIEDSEIQVQPGDPLFCYYKLHGSLNWLKCELCGQYYINPKGSILHNTFRDELDDRNTCICTNQLRLTSVLVTPSFVRDIRDANLLQIWKGALEAIRTADKLVMIGYSMPAEDLGIKSIIIRALNGRCKKELIVDVVQCGDGAKCNYENMFGRKNIRYFNRGLGDYLSMPEHINQLNKRPCPIGSYG